MRYLSIDKWRLLLNFVSIIVSVLLLLRIIKLCILKSGVTGEAVSPWRSKRGGAK